MSRTDMSKEGTRRNPNDGTSARTRAFGFEDIMSKRKEKQNSHTKDKDIKMDFFRSANNTLDHASPYHRQIMRASKETATASSKKEESTSRRERNHIKRKYTGAYDLEGMKEKSIHRKSNRDKKNTDEWNIHHSSKCKSSGRKRFEDFVEMDSYDDYRKFKRDREGDGHNQSKNRTENAKKYKKQESVRQRDSKYLERNGHMKYHNEPLYEDSRLMRSRSLGDDLEREKSTSLSPFSRKYAHQLQDNGESYNVNLRKKPSDGDKYKILGVGDRYKTSGIGDRYKTSGDDDRYKTFDDGDKHKTSGDVDRHKTSSDVDRHKTSGDVDRHKTSGDVDRHKTSSDVDRHKTSGGGDRHKILSDGDRHKTPSDDDRYKTFGDDDKYRTSGDGDRYKPLGDGDRYKPLGDGDRYKASGDGDRDKTLGNGDRYKTSVDGDKYKASGDGGYSGGHNWKQGSGLGGYSPRKRKSDAAVKTPSPTIRSPERKVATWDQLPSGTSITNTGSIFTNSPLFSKITEVVSSITSTSAATKTHAVTSINSATVVINASLESVQLTQATRPMRRLYIENLPPSASEKSVIDCLNEILVSSGANHIQTKPCISCIINKDKAQALVEFLTPEDATAALSFDGSSLFGSVLKMRRPKDFIEVAIGVPEKARDVAKIVSDVVKDSPYKIFVGGVSDIISSKMLKEIASAFGPLKAYHTEFNKDFKGLCAFLEYDDHMSTSKACAVLDGLMLGGCILTAVRAFPDMILGKEEDGSFPSYAVPSHAKPLLASPSQVLRLQNVINPEDIPTLCENELEEILEDIRLECARFGTVKAVHIVRQSSSSVESKPAATDLSGDVNNSADLESNIHPHMGCMDMVDETHDDEDIREASTSSFIGVINEDDIIEATDRPEDVQASDPISHFPSPRDLQDAKLTEDTNTDLITAEKGEGKDGKGNKEQKLIEGDEKASGDVPAHDSDALLPGWVLVEFQRKEAACAAAHCLHGRSYAEHTVDVGYIPYDVYLKRFPK